MQTFEDAVMQLRQCLIASKNRRDLGINDPNFPDTHRYIVSQNTLQQLHPFFMGLQATPEFKNLYPSASYRFEVATSYSAGNNVMDFKITPIGNGNSAIFNFHIGVERT